MDDFVSLVDKDSKRPLVSFGVLTDVQYADRDNAQSWYCADKVRYYRTSLDHIRKAFCTWEKDDHRVDFVMQLGDLFDACNRTLNLDSDAAVRKSLRVFDEFPTIPTYHVLGNHELDNFNRNTLVTYFGHQAAPMLGASEDTFSKMPLAYYKFSPVPEVVVVVLDCFDIALSGYDVRHPKYLKALELLCKFHTHEDRAMWDYDDHLEGMDKRFVAYNGAIDTDQMKWLDHELECADRNGQKVMLCGHISLLPASSTPSCILWNYQEVLAIIHAHSCVVAYLAGHLHDNGYAMDSHGIHHITFAGILEVHPSDYSFSTVRVFSEHLEIIGFGRERSYILHYKTPLVSHLLEEECVASIEVPVQA